MKKICLSVVNFILAVIAVILTVAVLIQVVMTAAILWIGSDKGQSWLQAQISESMTASGFTLSMGGLAYHSMQGIAATKVVLSDAQGEIFSADRLMAHVALLPLLDRHASVSLTGTNLVLSRLPEAKDAPAEPSAPLAPFSLPDIYVTSASLSVNVNRLELKEAVAGQEIILSPVLKVDADIENGAVSATALLTTGQHDHGIAYLPSSLSLKGMLAPQELKVALEDFKVEAQAYQASLKGRATLTDNGPLDLKLQARSDDLTPLAGQAGYISLDAALTGSMDKPLLNASGKAFLESLSAQGLGETTLNVSSELANNKPMGKALIASTYREKPVTLEADFEFNDPVLSLFHIAGTAPDISLSGEMSVNTASMLADGKIMLSADNLSTYADIAGVDISGSGNAEILMGWLEEKQSVSANANMKNIRYADMSVASVDASVVMNDTAVLLPDTLNLKVRNAVLAPDMSITALSLDVQNTEAQVYQAKIDASGRYPNAFQLKGSTAIGLIENRPEAKDINLNLTSAGASVAVTGVASEALLDLKIKLANLTAALIPGDVPDPVRSLTASGDVTLTGSTASPVIAAGMDFSALKLNDGLPAIKLSATGKYENSLASVTLNGTGEGIRTLKGQAELPLTLSLYPYALTLSEASPLKGDANFDLSGTRLLAKLLPPDHRFTGDLKGQVQISGTMAAPQAGGSVSVSNAAYLYEPYGVRLNDLVLQASLSDTGLTLQNLSATDGAAGRLSGKGIFDFKNAAQTRLDLKLSNYHLMRSQMVDGFIGADLYVSGQGEGYLLGGDIKLGEVNVTIPEQFKSSIPQLNIVTGKEEAGSNAALQSVALNINVDADNKLFVRGWGLDAEFGGTIAATGTLDDPQLIGEFTSRRGRYEEFGKRFTLAKASLRFQGSVPPSPYLDIDAQTNAGDVVASVLLTGSATKPKINFSSVPALPEDEVLSRILFGRNMERITPFQAVQLAQTLQRFSGKGGGGFDPLGEIRSLTGIDDISVDTDESGQTSVGVGKYITDKVYLQLEKGQGETSGAASIQVEVTPDINVESKVGQDAQAGGGVFWKHDY